MKGAGRARRRQDRERHGPGLERHQRHQRDRRGEEVDGDRPRLPSEMDEEVNLHMLTCGTAWHDVL